MPTHNEIVTAAHTTYDIHVGGTIDGNNTRDPVGYSNYSQAWENNLFVRLENTGETLVQNPRLVINDRRRWHSIDSILDEILQEDMTEADKALAIWEFARRHRYHSTTGDDEIKDPVKMLNLYGYTLCWDEAYTVSNLWQAAGLTTRRGIPHGHCTTEVFFDGSFHLLDSDEHLLVLLRDNETIASEEDLAHDHDLMKRSHAYGILQNENRQTSESAASLFIHTGPRSGERPVIAGHIMDISLRPGEALVCTWENRGKHHGRRPPRLCNGMLQFTPRLTDNWERWTAGAVNLHISNNALRTSKESHNSELCYQVRSPYVLVGGSLEAMLGAGECQVELSHDGNDWTIVGTARGDAVLELDDFFDAAGPATYSYFLRLRGRGLVLNSLRIDNDLQMAPLSLPALEVGKNSVVYCDDTKDERSVTITHSWQERSDCQPPPPPLPYFPDPGCEANGTQLTFVWEPVSVAVDYHLQVSRDPQFRHCLSPVFDKLISRTPSAGKTQWQIPCEGLLNPGTTYYWRLRSRNQTGLWGEWSPCWPFSVVAPGLPRDPCLKIDWKHRCVTLRWQEGAQGTTPHHYEIYGSNERGFTASRAPYPVYMGTEQPIEEFPANLLCEVDTPGISLPADYLRAFYRIVAVDTEGRRSGPSDLVPAKRPFIHSIPPKCITTGETTTYQVETVHSIGDLRPVSKGPRRYFTAFRDADRLHFILDEGPEFLQLDPDTGLLTATPCRQHISTHTVTIRVHNGQGGIDVQGFDLEVAHGDR